MRKHVVALLSWFLAVAAIAPQTSLADNTGNPEDGYFKKHFQLNGYFSLAYGDLNLEGARQRTTNEIVLGIPEDGSASYGNAALLLRYTPSLRHSFVLQLSGRRLGDSPVDDVEKAVEVDWMFYELQATDRTRLRLGRIPTSAGIFNEIRDVGLLLPFYRPSYVFYREGSLFSETIDGLAVSHAFLPAKAWSLDFDVYYGEYEVLEQGTGFSEGITEVDVNHALGSQLWLETPLPGLRLGLGGQRWDVSAESAFNFEETTWRSWYVSIDGAFEKFVVRGELRRVGLTAQALPSQPVTDAEIDLYYAQLGWLATDRLSFFVQPEFADITQANPLFVGGETKFREWQDIGFSVVYKLRLNLAVKGEYHDVRSENTLRDTVVLGPEGPRLLRTFQSFDSNYSIVSLSVGF